MAVNGVNGISSFNAVSQAVNDNANSQNEDPKSVSFGDYLKEALNNVNDLQVQSDKMSDDFAAGKIDNIHDVTIAQEKAYIALELTTQVRNKILDAYNEIMRMQI